MTCLMCSVGMGCMLLRTRFVEEARAREEEHRQSEMIAADTFSDSAPDSVAVKMYQQSDYHEDSLLSSCSSATGGTLHSIKEEAKLQGNAFKDDRSSSSGSGDSSQHQEDDSGSEAELEDAAVQDFRTSFFQANQRAERNAKFRAAISAIIAQNWMAASTEDPRGSTPIQRRKVRRQSRRSSCESRSSGASRRTSDRPSATQPTTDLWWPPAEIYPVRDLSGNCPPASPRRNRLGTEPVAWKI